MNGGVCDSTRCGRGQRVANEKRDENGLKTEAEIVQSYSCAGLQIAVLAAGRVECIDLYILFNA